MGFRKLNKVITEGFQLPFYFIHSTEPFFVTLAIEKIKELVPEEQLSFNLHQFDLSEGEADFGEIIDSANSPGFFQNSKFILLLHFERARKKEKEALLEYLKDPSPTTRLIIFSEKAPEAEIKSLLRSEQFISLELNQTQLRHWVKSLARQKGLDISEQIADLIITLTNSNAGMIYSEIEKLSLLEKGEVKLSDVTGVLCGSVSHNAFSAAEKLVRKEKVESFKMLKSLLSESEPIAVVGAINWKINDLAKKGKLKDRGRLKKALEILMEADKKLKNSQKVGVLEEAFFKLLQI